MSSSVVHQNIDVRKRKIIFWACLVYRRLWTHGTSSQIEGRSRRSVTIQLNLVTLPCGYGVGPTFHFVTMEPGGKQVNVIPPSISRCV